MQHLDLTFSTPEENLACDEALLDVCEEEGGPEVLRFWEPRRYFVVVGHSDRVDVEVDVAGCRDTDVPILRRHSGGGTVLQGPGSLCYALVLRIQPDGPLASINATNSFVLSRARSALQPLITDPVDIQGLSDLTLRGRKFSGSAQRRRLRSLLFHGTILLGLNVGLVERCLRMPSRQPAYRDGRSHEDFMTNLSLSVEEVKQALARAWDAVEEIEEIPLERMRALVDGRYAQHAWTFRL